MKRDAVKQLHQQTVPQLQQKLSELQQELVKARLALYAGKLEDVNQPAKLSDDIARVKTVMRQKQLIAAAAGTIEEQPETQEENQESKSDQEETEKQADK